MFNNISIVIQGPWDICTDYDKNINTNFLCNHYSKFGQVILSCYDYDIEKLNNIPAGVKVIKVSSHKETNFNFGNIYWQSKSTYYGMNEVNTDFVIKTRSNEFYEDFSPFIRAILDNPEKLIVTDIVSQKWTENTFHLTDHLIGGKSIYIKEIFNRIYNRCLSRNESGEQHDWMPENFTCLNNLRRKVISVEGVITIEFLDILGKIDLSKKDKYDSELGINLVKQNCIIIPTKVMGDNSRGSIHNSSGRKYFYPGYYDGEWLSNIEDL